MARTAENGVSARDYLACKCFGIRAKVAVENIFPKSVTVFLEGVDFWGLPGAGVIR